MSYLLDTCTISEFVRQKPDEKVMAWFGAQEVVDVYLSVVVVGELAKGIALLPESKKKRRLDAWLYTDLCDQFHGRILPVSTQVTLEWGTLTGNLKRNGVNLGMADGLIAATARVHSMVVVTRNVRDMSAAGVPVLNPWSDIE